MTALNAYTDHPNQVSPIAALLQAFAFSIASLAPPYPLFAGIFIFNGMGFGLEVGRCVSSYPLCALPSPVLPYQPTFQVLQSRILHIETCPWWSSEERRS